MKLWVALSMKFLPMLLMVLTLPAEELQTPATQEVATMPQLLAGAAPVHPASKGAQLLSQKDATSTGRSGISI